MRICFLVDYRSPIARSWIEYFIETQHEVHVISSHEAVAPTPGPDSLHCVPIGLANFRSRPALRRHLAITGGNDTPAPGLASATVGSLLRRISSNVQDAYQWIAPYEAYLHAGKIRRLIREIKPDLVHAMRIPFEAILGARALSNLNVPFLVSVWGNDFTLQARQNRQVARATRSVMRRANALHADCERDILLSRQWGLDAATPTLLVPGNGGIRSEEFFPGCRDDGFAQRWDIPVGSPVVLNARNFRPGYVRNDIFFAAIPDVLSAVADATFVCVGMRGNPIAERWIRRYDIAHAVRLLPVMRRDEMASLFRLADVAVSPSNHDGTPNTLLEAMACGAFPVAGDIESVREWIRDGENGLLCDPNDTITLAHTLVKALQAPLLRERAAVTNRRIILERAEYHRGMRRAEGFYSKIVESSSAAELHVLE